MKRFCLLAIIILSFYGPTQVFSEDISDYLILQDIGQFKLDKPEKMLPGEPPSGGPRTYDGDSAVAGSGHFPDHIDKSYKVMYLGDDANVSPVVRVAQHASGDADQWLLHEVEDSYRDGDDDDGKLGLLSGDGVTIREISGNKIIYWGFGGGNYTWINAGNIVVEIQYVNLQGHKPEPLEVVQAYLQKFPSTIPTTLVLDSVHNEKWLKDEMARRLWLCDKWLDLIVNADPDLSEKLEEVSKNLIVFLNYREKYFEVSAREDKKLVYGYRDQNNEAGMLAKVAELKTWWNDNKSGSINLP